MSTVVVALGDMTVLNHCSQNVVKQRHISGLLFDIICDGDAVGPAYVASVMLLEVVDK